MDELKAAEAKIRNSANKSNSKKEIAKVVTRQVKTRKRPISTRIKESIIQDNSQSIGSYILWDVLIPGIKDAIWNIGSGGLEMALFGETRRSRRGSSGGLQRAVDQLRGPTYISYDRMATTKRSDSDRRSRSTHEFDDIVFDTKSEAEEVLSNMVDIASEYGFVSVHDFYELCGLEGKPVDEKWGWTNLSKADTRRVSDGYIIMLPKTVHDD